MNVSTEVVHTRQVGSFFLSWKKVHGLRVHYVSGSCTCNIPRYTRDIHSQFFFSCYLDIYIFDLFTLIIFIPIASRCYLEVVIVGTAMCWKYNNGTQMETRKCNNNIVLPTLLKGSTILTDSRFLSSAIRKENYAAMPFRLILPLVLFFLCQFPPVMPSVHIHSLTKMGWLKNELAAE